MLAWLKTAAWMLCLTFLTPMLAQDAPQSKAFDVATIKPVDPEAPIVMIGIGRTDDGIDGQNVSLAMLMRMAYGYWKFPLDSQVTGVPDWAKTQRFNIKAKMSEADALALKTLTGDEREQRLEAMVQTLLAERFTLKVHKATKEAANYELVVGKSGFKLKPAGETDPTLLKGRDGMPLAAGTAMFQRDGTTQCQLFTMDALAIFLTQSVPDIGRTVANKTGISGEYSFRLHWSPNRIPSAGDTEAPSIFTALEEDLGLRLQPSRGPIDIVVIDHVEPPSKN